MSTKIFIPLLLLFHLELPAQMKAEEATNKGLTFFKQFTVDQYTFNRGISAIEVSDGYVLTGYVSGHDSGSGEDIVVLKTTTSGDLLWSKVIRHMGTDNGWAVRQTEDQGLILVGSTNSLGSGGMDVYLVRMDDLGNVIWTKTYGGPRDEFGWDVRLTRDKGFIIAAQTDSFGAGEIDAYLIKVNSNGESEWSKTFGGEKTDRIFSVRQAQDGGFAAAGITYSFTSVSPQDRDGYVLKTDAFGNEEWSKTIGKDKYDVAHSIALTDDNGYILTGYGESYSQSGARDVYLIKLDKAGMIQWIKSHGDRSDNRGLSGVQTRDGGYVSVGITDLNRDIYLVKTDGVGEKLWTKTFGDSNRVEFGYAVVEASDGGLLIVGHSENPADGIFRILLIKTNKDGEL